MGSKLVSANIDVNMYNNLSRLPEHCHEKCVGNILSQMWHVPQDDEKILGNTLSQTR